MLDLAKTELFLEFSTPRSVDFLAEVDLLKKSEEAICPMSQ